MSPNEALKRKAAQLLQEGNVFAFGLSERHHGADIYSTEMRLTPQPDGTYRADGEKYYIGNANLAPMVSTFGKLADSGDYVFFAADYRHKNYELIRNVTASQNYVAQYALHDYPITEADILSRGQEAWDACLNTVNIGKFNLGWASIGICTHAFYEAIRHAANRRLYNMAVTDFPHVQQMFTDAYARLVAMKLFALRAADYMRAASPDDRRYLLYNPMVKMKVTTQGEEVINLLWDVIAAKGFERDTYFEMAARDIRALPKLEGTVHVNIALIVKFMPNYFFNPAEYPEIPRQDQARNDDFLFHQGPARGLGQIRFHDYHAAFERFDLPNVNRVQGTDRRLQGVAGDRHAGRGPAEGHRLPAGAGRDLHPGRLRPAHPRERRDLRGRKRPARPDLRLHGARFLAACPAALQQAQQHARADGTLPADDPQTGRGSSPFRPGVEGAGVRVERCVRDESVASPPLKGAPRQRLAARDASEWTGGRALGMSRLLLPLQGGVRGVARNAWPNGTADWDRIDVESPGFETAALRRRSSPTAALRATLEEPDPG